MNISVIVLVCLVFLAVCIFSTYGILGVVYKNTASLSETSTIIGEKNVIVSNTDIQPNTAEVQNSSFAPVYKQREVPSCFS